jgi:hypothetical protein
MPGHVRRSSLGDGLDANDPVPAGQAGGELVSLLPAQVGHTLVPPGYALFDADRNIRRDLTQDVHPFFARSSGW